MKTTRTPGTDTEGRRMINSIIRWSVQNRIVVLMLAAIMAAWGAFALRNTPVDAIPDLSDVQVIIRTSFPGQAPRVVEDQVTYPLATAMLAVPGAVTVRGYSFFGDSYVYVLFEDGTDLYWARSRVLEYLSQVAGSLPAGVRPALGPDATGVGWVFQYALVDRSGRHDIAELRSLQDWFLKYEIQALPGVAEVASVGGMVRQYEILLDPERLRAWGISLTEIRESVASGNQEVGGSVIELGEAEYMVRATGYVDSLEKLRELPLKVTGDGVPVLLGDVADVRFGPAPRRGVADLDGEGEAVGGIVVMRWGENATDVIRDVRERLDELALGLPEGVEIVTVYDRSALIERAQDTLRGKLIQELLLVALVCAVFLFHARSTLVAVISLPLGVLGAFIAMYHLGINANIMSLGGIAIAIGVMVDAAIVMVENLHKHMEAGDTRDHWQRVVDSAAEVGPAVFFSLLVITVSFLPVFALQAQEGRLFSPLAYTKTFAMAAAAILAITLVPVLMGYCVRGRIRPESANPVNRFFAFLYRPVLRIVLRFPWLAVSGALVLVLATAWPASRLGTEFMPDLDEGDLMYMPTTLPGISVGEARQLLQQTDRLIATVPEVESVFGKVGRATTATDPAPLTMIETLIQLRPRSEWREGMTLDKLKEELDARVRFPGLANAWVMPIKTRIDMLATGIRTPLGIKISGPDLSVIQDIGTRVEQAVGDVPGTRSVYAERVLGGRYIVVDIDRLAASRFGLSVDDLQRVVALAIGGMPISESLEGRERYPIRLRFYSDWRDSPEKLRNLPLSTPTGAWIGLGDVADIRIEAGPAMIRSENARPAGWVFVDVAGRDLGGFVEEVRQRVGEAVELPPGYSLDWSGQYEYLQRAKARLGVLVPVTLAIIVLLLYLQLRSFREVLIVLGTLPMSLVGGIWLLYLLDFRMSVAVAVGFIALAGMAVEVGVVMLVYLRQALTKALESGQLTADRLRQAVTDGALMRLRPVLMTVTATLVGLLPIMVGTGTGAEVTRRIAAPMVGGVLSLLPLALLVVPSLYLLAQRRNLSVAGSRDIPEEAENRVV
jgi:Cu(I)/Ag(I) efflux system membrane protein CusA/SilA